MSLSLVISIIFVVLATLSTVLGLVSNSLIITYLRKKPMANKTAFDDQMIDMIFAAMIFCVFLNLVFILHHFLDPVPFGLKVILTIVTMVLAHLFFSSVTVVLMFKIVFLRFSHLVLSIPDSTSRIIGWIFKFCLVLIGVLLDNFGPISTSPLPCELLNNGQPNNECWWNVGLGFPFNVVLSLFMVITVQIIATSMSTNDIDKAFIQWLASIAIIQVIFTLIVSILTIVNGETPAMAILQQVIIFLLLVDLGQVFPFVAIWRTPNMRQFVESFFIHENMYPVNE